MTDNDIAMIAELVTWNRQNGIQLKSLWSELSKIYQIKPNSLARLFYKRMNRGKYKKRGRPRCTRTEDTYQKNT